MIRRCLMFLACILLSAIYAGCETMPSIQTTQQQEAAYVANFNYIPPSQVAGASLGVTVTIADPSYPPGCFISEQFKNLDNAVKEDLKKIFLAKGFSLRGTFETYDLIPYQDKKAIDMFILPLVELSITSKGVMANALTDRLATADVSGKIVLEVREITTKKLMWAKTIPLKPMELPLRGAIHWAADVVISDVNDVKPKPVLLEQGQMNEVAKSFEKQYPDVMNTIWKLIDPEEMTIIKKHCQELKKKEGY